MHEPAELTHVSRFNKKQGGNHSGGRKWNVWYMTLQCPVCGRQFVRPVNPFRGRGLRCVGSDQLKMTKKAGKPLAD